MKWLLSLFAIATVHGDTIPAGPLLISPESKSLIIEFETGGKSYYQSRLQRPTWPGGASGATIGLGYDLGYNTKAQIRTDWSGLPDTQITALTSAAGYKGTAAKYRVSALRWIIIPWDAAERVFVTRTMPRFGSMTDAAFPAITRTHSHVQGSMLSIVFNRGSSLTGSSRIEMRAIRDHIAAGRISAIPREIRAMKRLWIGKGLDGLLRRREAEAQLIEKSLHP